MNRLIKFRVWDKLKKEWFDSYTFLLASNNNGFWSVESDDGKLVTQQFTGLKDKNSKEIYEGDILYHSNEKLNILIEWGKCGWIFTNKNHPEDMFFLTKEYQKEVAVVGNIFENPELLK